MVRPVNLAHRKITLAATANRMDAVVKTPIPEKASLTATALDPNIMHKNTVNTPEANEISWLDGCVSVIGHRIIKGNSRRWWELPTLHGKYRYQRMLIFRVGNYTTGEGLARHYHPEDQDFAPGARRVLERHQCQGIQNKSSGAFSGFNAAAGQNSLPALGERPV
jgi:hypothetical protein